MKFQRYFKPGQQLLLKATNPKQDGRTELISVLVTSISDEILIVSLPYGADAVNQYPFEDNSAFEITTETLGLGLRTSGTFLRRINGSQFSLKMNQELEMFKRRISQRFDCELGIRFSRAAKTLQTMREIWEKNLEVINTPNTPVPVDDFQKAKVNISSGGIRLTIKPPASQGELCLILINLNDGKPPVCTIAEIVWTCSPDESLITVGMRFINILAEDQLRIDDFINQQKSQSQPAE